MIFILASVVVGIVVVWVAFALFFVVYDGWKVRNVEWWIGKENVFINKAGEPSEFPTVFEKGSIYLSLVVPAYNEEERLGVMLDEALGELVKMRAEDPKKDFEIIVVNDGSRDRTTEVALKYGDDNNLTDEEFRVLSLQKNRGKGGAVKRGVLCSRGRLILFADADGASKFGEVHKLIESIEENTMTDIPEDEWSNLIGDDLYIAVGSRAHLEESHVERTMFRTILMLAFHSLVVLFTVRGVKDTQCGFKLFTRKTAQLIIPVLRVERWAFDPELLFLASRLGIGIDEIPIDWEEIDGSKLTFWGMATMGKDLVRIWFMYKTGVWGVPKLTRRTK